MKHVLVLHSYHKGLEWTDNEDEGIMSVLKTRQLDIEVHTEYLDAKRVADGRSERSFFTLLKRKYANIRFTVVLATDDDAYNFYLRNHDALFAGAPVVFCGVNYFKDSDRAGRENLITGVIEAFNVPDTLRTALRFHPETRRIVVINDRTTTGRANRKILDQVLPAFEEKTAVLYLDDLAMQEALAAVGGLRRGDIILLMTFNRDRTGRVFDYNQSIALISGAAQVPIYGVWDFYLGKGIVGGMLTSGTDQGRIAAQTALRIIDGEKVRNLPVVKESPNRFMFDYLQLKRFGINPARIPRGSILINEPDAFYVRYRSAILIGSAVIFILCITIIILLVYISLRKRYEMALSESEHKYRDLYDNAPDMYYSLNREGLVVDCNETEANMLGYRKDEIIGRPVTDFITTDSRRAYEKDFATVAEHEALFGLEREFVRKDGTTFPASLNVFVELDRHGTVVRTKTIARDMSEAKRVELELLRSREELRNLSAHIQSARENERMSIAREIHDELGQVLSKLKLDIAWLRKRITGEQLPLLEKTDTMSGLVDSTIRTVQKISSELRPGVLDHLGLSAAVEWQVREFSERTGIPCAAEIAPEIAVEDKSVAIAVFRIFQEALTNVMRHALATNVDVSLKQEDHLLILEVRDNGKGMPDTVTDHESFGLMGMRERARYLGGSAVITGAPGQGTTVVVRIPLDGKAKL